MLLSFSQLIFAQVTVEIDLAKDTHPISKYLYGRNNSLSGNPGSGFTPEWTRLKDAGVHFLEKVVVIIPQNIIGEGKCRVTLTGITMSMQMTGRMQLKLCNKLCQVLKACGHFN